MKYNLKLQLDNQTLTLGGSGDRDGCLRNLITFLQKLAGPEASDNDLGQLVLKDVGPNKIAVIKSVRDATGMGLKEAKDLVESPLPQVINTGIMAKLRDMQNKFQGSGGVVSINPGSNSF